MLGARGCALRAPLWRAAACRRLALRRRALNQLSHARSDSRAADEALSDAPFDALWRQAGALPAEPPVRLAHTALGRGLVVQRGALCAGDLVVSLPWSAVLCVTDGDTAEGPADQRLARALLTATAAGSSNALWRSYAAALPAATGAAALWRAEEVEELQAAAAVDAAHGARLHFRAQAARLQPTPARDALWALSLVHSRSFALDVAGQGRIRVLAPLADMVNNEQPSAAAAASGDDDDDDDDDSPWRHSDGRFELRAARRFEQGEEVLMYYGHESSADLLISYGFAPEPNAADYVPLYTDLRELLDDDRWTAGEPARVSRAKAALLYAGAASRAPLAVRPGGTPAAAHLLGCLRMVHADAADVAQLEERMDEHVGHLTWQWREGSYADAEARARMARADAAARAHAAARARELLDDMPSTAAEDAALLAQLQAEAGARDDAAADDDDEDGEAAAAARLLAAVRFRLGVKRMLQRCVDEASA